ncbi:hypothetical protein [Scytonema sp. NUACC26]|uniref:hypothetical protein n=1 Tax=Scytonema sp. NUACC26 TaxID=3140176 RepID=UPI0038B3DB9E
MKNQLKNHIVNDDYKPCDRRYGNSDLFATRSQYRNNLSEVLRILKHLGSIITS